MVKKILLIFGYVALGLGVVVMTFALVAYGNDYAYDWRTGQIVQRGHVILASLPSRIKVKADGKQLGDRTPYQEVFDVGQHTFELAKDGYQTWKKTVSVVAGQVTLINYALLVPTEPKRIVQDTRDQLVAPVVSADRRHLAYIVPGVAPAVYIMDVGSAQPVKQYQARAASGDVPQEQLESVVWSDDASHLLVRSKIGPTVTYRVLAAGGGEVINLTDTFKFDFSGINFSAYSWRQLYWISPEGLRRLDVDSRSVSAVLADNVSQFWMAGDRVLYVRKVQAVPSLWSVDRSGRQQQLIAALPVSDSYSVVYANYDGSDVLAVVPKTARVGTLYRNIYSDNPATRVIARDVDNVNFSPDGHLVLFYSAVKQVAYDLKRNDLIGDDASYEWRDQPESLTSITWFDNYHLLTVRGGKLYLSEYDGFNVVDLGVMSATLAVPTNDYKSVLMTAPAGGGVAITLTEIR
jgi:hypothetical protein